MFLVGNDGKVIEVENAKYYVDENGKIAELLPCMFYVDENGKIAELMGGGVRRVVLLNGTDNNAYHSKYSDDYGETWINANDSELECKSAVSNGEIICIQKNNASTTTKRDLGYTLNGEDFTIDAIKSLSSGYLAYIPETEVFVHTSSINTGYVYVKYSEDGKTWQNSKTIFETRWSYHTPMIYDAVNKNYLVAANGDICSGGNSYPPFCGSYVLVYDAESNSDWQVNESGGLATHDGLTVAQVHMSGSGVSSGVIYSLDAKTWTRCNYGDNQSTLMYTLRYIRDRFIAFCEDEDGTKYIRYTFDGKTWTKGGSYVKRPAVDAEIIDLGDELIYFSSNTIYSSTDGGLSWTTKKTFTSSADKILNAVMSYLE